MAWIKSHSELLTHPKVKKAARVLGISVVTMIGHLHALWWWAMDHAPDGLISAYDPEEIADAVMWEGDIQAFLDALVNCGAKECPGLLDVLPDGGLMIHDWEEHCGREYEKRTKEAERLRAYRARKKGQRTSDVHSTNDVRDTDERVSNGVRNANVRCEKEIEKDIKDYSPSESVGETPPQKTQAEDIHPEDCPQAMREVVDYFLAKTGREGISPDELSAVRALEKIHVPHRVMTEITKALERYSRHGKPHCELTLKYIYESLQFQKSGAAAKREKRLPEARAAPPRKNDYNAIVIGAGAEDQEVTSP